MNLMDILVWVSVVVAVLALGIAAIVWLFGDDLFRQFFGRSIGEVARSGFDKFLYLIGKIARRSRSKQVGPSSTFREASTSEFSGRYLWTRETVIAHVHKDLAVLPSAEVQTAFNQMNERRAIKDLERLYPGPRFRPIATPSLARSGLTLELAPIDYMHVALMKETRKELAPPSATKSLIRKQISLPESKLQAKIRDKQLYLSSIGYNILGMEVCLITSDDFILIRRRGKHVVTGKRLCDTSVSGHPNEEDLRGDSLDLTKTVRREAERWELAIAGNPMEIKFTGMHRNDLSGDIDVLGYWRISSNAHELGLTLSRSYGLRRFFKTTEPRREPFVEDYENLIVEFDGTAIREVLAAQKPIVSLEGFLPEALKCIEWALLSENRPPLGLSQRP